MTPGGDLTLAALKMVLALIVVLGGMALCYWVVRRMMGSPTAASKSNVLRVVASVSLAPKTRICMVEVPGRILVVGHTGQQMSLLSEIDDPDSLEKIHQYLSHAPAGNFLEQLRKISNKPTGKSSVDASNETPSP